MVSIYRQYFEAIEGVTDKMKCTVEKNGKKCNDKVDSKKASNLQDHLKRHHTEFYVTIQASPKSALPSNQPSLASFAVTTAGKSFEAMRDLQMFYSTSTAAINDLKNPHLKKLLNRIPNFKVPDGRKLKKNMSELLDKSIERIVDKYLTEDSCFSLSLDIATTRGMKNSYLGLVATFFDRNDRLRRIALDLRRLTGRHDATAIKNEAEQALNHLKLSFENVICTVTDGAKAMKAAFKELFGDKFAVELIEMDEQIEVASESEASDNDSSCSDIDLDQFDDDLDFDFNFPRNAICAAHTLQLVLKDIFENCAELKQLNQKVSRILNSINSSTIAASFIKEKSGKSVIGLFKIRWSTVALCFKRLVEIFHVVNEACKQCNFGTFSLEDKLKMEAILRFVHPFKILTDRFQAESEPTLSLIYPGIMSLIECLKVENGFEEARNGLIVCLKDRFGHVITTDENFDAKYLIATALDPNTARSLDFSGHELSGLILEMYAKLVNDTPTQNTTPLIDDDALFSFAPAPKKRKNSPEEEHQQSIKDEFLSFYEEAIKKRRKFEDFWALRKKQFPRIYILATKLLSVPASTASVERLFSKLAIHTNGHKTNSKASLTRVRVLSSFNREFL